VLRMERAVFEVLCDFRSEALGLEYLLEPGPKSRKFVSHPSPARNRRPSRDELARRFVLGQHKAAR
jgi:hypothetical protein